MSPKSGSCADLFSMCFFLEVVLIFLQYDFFFRFDTKGKQIVEPTSLSLHEEMYNVIQTLFDDHTNDLHLVAWDPYHFPY